MSARTVNRRVKGWPGWVALVLVVAAFLAVGAARSTGPQTPEDRVDAITARIACPVCDGESVFESQNNASRAIRDEVTGLVRANELGDDEIVAFVENRYGAEVLLVPRATGFDALVWVLPAVGAVCALAGLALAFRRWRRDADAVGDVTPEDRALVLAALDADPDAAPASTSPRAPVSADGGPSSAPPSDDEGAGP
jgi:cytochrome c-type biogenesis protein CcmH